jgi:hypothetical protein
LLVRIHPDQGFRPPSPPETRLIPVVAAGDQRREDRENGPSATWPIAA